MHCVSGICNRSFNPLPLWGVEKRSFLGVEVRGAVEVRANVREGLKQFGCFVVRGGEEEGW